MRSSWSAVELFDRHGDGVEAFRFGDSAYGVQFHPEQNPEDLRLFKGFVEAARNYRKERTENLADVHQHV